MIEISMAILVHNQKIFIAQRNIAKHMGGMWEFPGGKLEAGETLQECVARELMEEFGKEITVGEKFMDYSYTYPEKGEFHLNAFWCTCSDEKMEPTEHMDYKWVSISELDNFEFCPADLPFIEKLKNLA